MIKAIETRYKGYRFRSRLEARWAVFFDACGYQWEYEPEGFDLPCGTHYLPDFKIFGEDYNGDYNVFWIEVKPSENGLTDAKVSAFRQALWAEVQGPYYENRTCQGYGDFIVLDGPPANKAYYGTFCFAGHGGRQWLMEPIMRGRPSFWDADTLRSGGIYVDASYSYPIKAALSARFEHGENSEAAVFGDAALERHDYLSWVSGTNAKLREIGKLYGAA